VESPSRAVSASAISRDRETESLFPGSMIRLSLRNGKEAKIHAMGNIEQDVGYPATAGITLYELRSVKTIPGIRTYVGVDGGMTDNIRPALYEARYHAISANKADWSHDTVVTIAGKCCESGDILVKDVGLAEPKPGDIVAVFSTGAYNHSMASNYNRIPRPAVVMTTGEGRHRLSVRRESYEDMLIREF